MKIFFFIIAFLFTANLSFAADWDIIRPDINTHYVSEADSTIHTIDIRIHKQVEDSDIYYNYYMNEVTNGTYARPNCVIEKGDGWLGRKVIFSLGGTESFSNKQRNIITFNIKAKVGDKWKMMKLKYGNYLEAQIIEKKDTLLFGNLKDSVRIISLTEKNNLDKKVKSDLNNLKFVLSKHYGLTAMYNMFFFPDSIITYNLQGVEGTAGLVPIKFKEVFDFDIGDIFHIYEGDTINYFYRIYRWRRIKVIDKTFIAQTNTFDYEVENQVMQITRTKNSLDTVYNDNLLHLRYKLDDYTDYLPEQSYIIKRYKDTLLSSNIFYVKKYGGRQLIRFGRKYRKFKLPCFVNPSRAFSKSSYFIQGCGDFYEEKNYGNHKWKRLVYYKKKDKEWGKKLNFVVGVNERSDIKSLHLVKEILNDNEALTIDGAESGIYNLTISDLTGRIVRKSEVYFDEGLNKIQIDGLSNGIYYAIFVKGNYTYFAKFNIFK